MAEVPDGDALEERSLDSHSLELLLTVARALSCRGPKHVS